MSSIASPTTTMRHSAIFLSRAAKRSLVKRWGSVTAGSHAEAWARPSLRLSAARRRAHALACESREHALLPEPPADTHASHKASLVGPRHVSQVVHEVHPTVGAHREPLAGQLRREGEPHRALHDAGEERGRRIIRRDRRGRGAGNAGAPPPPPRLRRAPPPRPAPPTAPPRGRYA